MSNTEFDDNSRQLALEVIVSLSETAPGMMRKLESLVGVLSKCTAGYEWSTQIISAFNQVMQCKRSLCTVQQALAMMMEQEDDEEWSQADELDEEDNERCENSE